ncbi:hypothetical protein KP509_21G048600 [Ceratopteris richardii]|uniref:Uncharacterized protein n=1 Tax=Ceratopteris richardii TaxID=49495 RepID=A0A8T2SCT4_CERRI|nr:hypothetical protein KP509_21G048600 [Ceratopteris richardii]
MATVTNLKQDVTEWRCGAAPLTAMMTVKIWLRGPGVSMIGKPTINFTKVDLNGKPYQALRQNAGTWLLDDLYRNPGPIQYNGQGANLKTVTLSIQDQDYIGRIQELWAYLEKVKKMVQPGCPEEVLKAALSSMSSVIEVLSDMSAPACRGITPY